MINLGSIPNPQIKLICKKCKGFFYVYPYREHKAKFCSRSCGSKSKKMETHNAWKGGRSLMRNGYVRIRIKGKYIYEHRYIMGKILNHKLKKDQCVHHINGNKSDNSIRNLIVMTKTEHDRMENKRRWETKTFHNP